MSTLTDAEIDSKIRDYLQKQIQDTSKFSPLTATRHAIVKNTHLTEEEVEWGLLRLEGKHQMFVQAPKRVEKIWCFFPSYFLVSDKNSRQCMESLFDANLAHHRFWSFTVFIFAIFCTGLILANIFGRFPISVPWALFVGGVTFLLAIWLTVVISNKYYLTLKKIKTIKFFNLYVAGVVVALILILVFWNGGLALSNVGLLVGIVSGVVSTLRIIVGLVKNQNVDR